MRKILIPTLEYPPQTGGIAEYLRNLVATLGEDQVEVIVWQKRNWLPLLAQVLWRCMRQSTRPRAILVHHVLPIGTIAFCAHKLFGVPYAIFFHGYDAALLANTVGRKKALGKRILGAASLVVANSNATLANIHKTAPSLVHEVVVYPCPSVAPSQEALKSVPALREKIIPGGGTLFVTSSRLVRRKGTRIVLEAFAVFHQTHSNSALVVMGDGPERAALEVFTKKNNLASAVHFTGTLAPQECAHYFAAADMFVMTPIDEWPDVEGFGMVYLEAAQFGKPSIGSTAGGVPEAVINNKTGIIVPQNDSNALTRAMATLAEDEALRATLGAAAQHRTGTEFTWSHQLAPVLAWVEKTPR